MKPLRTTPLVLLLIIGCSEPSDRSANESANESTQADAAASFIGTEACVDCHQAAYDDWQESHHQLAMQVATPDTVLGDFANAEFEYFGETTKFARRDNGFFVETTNANGLQEEFVVTDTFGVFPLQQYLVEYKNGRKQSLPFTWDSRPADEGGQRWYHLYGDEFIAADDPLHWTGQYFNWNTGCAECHSTDLQVGYDPEADSFDTTYSEISVGCEACHGPGSTHTSQANAADFDENLGLEVDLDDRRGSAWVMNADTGIAELNVAKSAQQQPEACGRCHARRGIITGEYEHGQLLTDTHMPSLLTESLYYADGRIKDEVYVYGSFLQSKMYAAGVTCSDCHNAHSGALRTGPDPNDVCAQCHLPAKFATADHSDLMIGNCVDCHMPATTYMGVDDRRDHSFRIPGAGEKADHYGAAIAAGRHGNANAMLTQALTQHDFPAIARATMLTLLQSPLTAGEEKQLLDSLDDADSLVRIGALRALRDQDPALRMRAGSHLLRDPVRAVRAEAALTYVEYRDLLPLDDARAYRQAATDYREAMRATLDRPLSALNLAEFESMHGDLALAEKYFEHAVSVGPRYAPARHAFGLFLVRAGNYDGALTQLEAAAALAPDVPRYAFVFGVALNSRGENDRAIEFLSEARNRFPDDFDIGWALATMLRDSGDRETALTIARDLRKKFPGIADVDALIQQLDPHGKPQ